MTREKKLDDLIGGEKVIERTASKGKVKELLSDFVCSAGILFCKAELPKSMIDAISINLGKTAYDLSEILIGEDETEDVLGLAETKFRKYTFNERLANVLAEVRKNDLN